MSDNWSRENCNRKATKRNVKKSRRRRWLSAVLGPTSWLRRGSIGRDRKASLRPLGSMRLLVGKIIWLPWQMPQSENSRSFTMTWQPSIWIARESNTKLTWPNSKSKTLKIKSSTKKLTKLANNCIRKCTLKLTPKNYQSLKIVTRRPSGSKCTMMRKKDGVTVSPVSKIVRELTSWRDPEAMIQVSMSSFTNQCCNRTASLLSSVKKLCKIRKRVWTAQS